MKKSEYLNDPDVSAFLDYFKEIVFGGEGSFCQSYKPKRKKKTGKLFSISSFKQAYDEYWWDESDFKKTHNKLKGYSGQIERHLKSTDYTPTLITSLRILDWGGVVNQHSVRWLVDSHEDSTICQKIERAIEILSSEDDSGTEEFEDNILLRSDSATTKIFSLGSEMSIIYDDRVGGALARIAREYLESSGAENVPEFLNFMRGSANGRARNPSTKQFRFRGKETGHLHALSNIRANWLIQKIVKDKRFGKHFCCPGKAESYKMRILESALFMIGYDLTTIENITVPKKTLARILFLKGQAEGTTPQEIKQSFIDDVPFEILNKIKSRRNHMPNLRDHISQEIENGNLGEVFSPKEVTEINPIREDCYVNSQRYPKKSIREILANHSIGPGDRIGQSILTGEAIFFRRLRRATYSIFSG